MPKMQGNGADVLLLYSELGKSSSVNVSLPEGKYAIYFKVKDNDGGWSEEKSANVSALKGVGENNDIVNYSGIVVAIGSIAVFVVIWRLRWK